MATLYAYELNPEPKKGAETFIQLGETSAIPADHFLKAK